VGAILHADVGHVADPHLVESGPLGLDDLR
jgi:hypothetical protein